MPVNILVDTKMNKTHSYSLMGKLSVVEIIIVQFHVLYFVQIGKFYFPSPLKLDFAM